MALPTPPTSPLTWTRVPSANPGVGPDLYYTSATSSIGASRIYQVAGGTPLVVASGVAPDGPTVTWTKLAGTGGSTIGPDLYYVPIEASGSHGLYLLPGGRLAYE